MFEFLKPYKYENIQEERFTKNNFFPVTEEEILNFEKKFGYELPSQLKAFYREIGYGFLTRSHEYQETYQFSNTNRINPTDLMIEMIEHGQSSGIISADAHELLQHGDIPFFEIGDSSSFLKMKALSDNPNAVWDMDDNLPLKIADSLEEFIHKLYYEDPGYYGRIYTEFCDRMNL